MKNYADSLVKYYNKWELGNSEDLAQIEKGFLTAIFSTLGRDSAEVDWYMANNRTDGEREEYIQRLLPLIEEMKKGIDMSKPPVSRDPSHEFYKLLLIKEGSSKLIVHYIYTKQQEHNEKIKKTLKRKEYNFSDIYGILYIK
jgi:hypothetical protein